MVLSDSGDGEASRDVTDVAAGDVGAGVTGGGVDTRDDDGGGDGAGMDVFSTSCRPLDTVKLKPVSFDWFRNAR